MNLEDMEEFLESAPPSVMIDEDGKIVALDEFPGGVNELTWRETLGLGVCTVIVWSLTIISYFVWQW